MQKKTDRGHQNMSTIMPKEKRVRDALTWISEHRGQAKDEGKLLEEAIFRYNLTPREEEYLRHLFRKSDNEGQSE
jgi:hypothetical protein